MRKLFISSIFIFLVTPSFLFGDPIILDNDSYHVYLADSYSQTVEETREKYIYSFEVTNKKKGNKKDIKIKTYGIIDAFLTPDRLNVIVHVLPPNTSGRTPVAKFYQYNLSSLKQIAAIGGLQDTYFSPNKKFGIMEFTFNPYEENEFDADGFIDLTKGSPRLKWLDNRKEKVNVFDGLMGDGKKFGDLEGPIGWTPDDNEMAFIIKWNTFNDDKEINGHGYYLVRVKDLSDNFNISFKPVDLSKIERYGSPQLTAVEISKNKAILTSMGHTEKIELELPN